MDTIEFLSKKKTINFPLFLLFFFFYKSYIANNNFDAKIFHACIFNYLGRICSMFTLPKKIFEMLF